jgi:hypothetical protein
MKLALDTEQPNIAVVEYNVQQLEVYRIAYFLDGAKISKIVPYPGICVSFFLIFQVYTNICPQGILNVVGFTGYESLESIHVTIGGASTKIKETVWKRKNNKIMASIRFGSSWRSSRQVMILSYNTPALFWSAVYELDLQRNCRESTLILKARLKTAHGNFPRTITNNVCMSDRRTYPRGTIMNRTWVINGTATNDLVMVTSIKIQNIAMKHILIWNQTAIRLQIELQHNQNLLLPNGPAWLTLEGTFLMVTSFPTWIPGSRLRLKTSDPGFMISRETSWERDVTTIKNIRRHTKEAAYINISPSFTMKTNDEQIQATLFAESENELKSIELSEIEIKLIAGEKVRVGVGENEIRRNNQG